MDRGNVWSVPVGKGDAFIVVARDSSGEPLELAGNEPLTALVWEGDDRPTMAGVIVLSHYQPSAGEIRADVKPLVTAALAPGFYRVELDVAIGGVTYPFYEGWLELQDSPGSAAAPPVYCSLQDMIDLAGEWLPELLSSRSRTNFLAQRARAREWLDRVILAKVRPMGGPIDLLSGPFTAYTAPEADDPYIAAALKADQLIVTPGVREACARYAIALVCEQQITDADKDVWPARALRFRASARQVLTGLNPGLDFNGDGRPDYTVNLGYFSLR